MRLKLSDLQAVVEQTIQEKQAINAFCEEIKRVFGPTVVVADTLESLSEQANYRLDVLERTGRIGYVNFSNEIALKATFHKNPEVRRLAVRLLPESSAVSFIYDKDPAVRYEAAKKSPLRLVENSFKKYPDDDNLESILQKKLLERKDSALEAAVEGPSGEEFLSDAWYEKTARKVAQDYNKWPGDTHWVPATNLDTGWIPAAVKQYCAGNRATNRFNIDAIKLTKALLELLAAHEEERLEKLELKESSEFSNVKEDISETNDLVKDLVESNLSSQDFLTKAEVIFGIKHSMLPPGIRKYALGEGKAVMTTVPTVGSLPHLSSPRYLDETALDSYVKHWNSQQSMRGEPYKLSWSPHPDAQNKISFHLELK